jgi:outer membrane protein
VLKIDKKQVKIVCIAVAAVFVLSIVGLAMSQSNTLQASASPSNIGKVNIDEVMRSHPDFKKAGDTFNAEVEQAQKDFAAKAPTLANDKEREAYSAQIQQRLSLRQAELIKPIEDKVMAAIKEVADVKGLAVVMPTAVVIHGGQDITGDVKKKLGIQ